MKFKKLGEGWYQGLTRILQLVELFRLGFWITFNLNLRKKEYYY